MRAVLPTLNALVLMTGLASLPFEIEGAVDPAVYLSSDGNTKMTFQSMQIKQKPNGISVIELGGGVHIVAKKQEMDIRAEHATSVLADKGGKSSLQTIHATHNVLLTKSSAVKGGIRLSTVASDVMDYREGPEGATADFTGAVVLTDSDSAKRSKLHATGAKGSADFSGGLGSKHSDLLSAVLVDAVHVEVDQAPLDGKKPGKLNIHCAKLTYTPFEKTAIVKLQGNVTMQGTNGAVNGSMRDLQVVTLHLDENHELTRYEAGSEH
jgi:hypothetical protein